MNVFLQLLIRPKKASAVISRIDTSEKLECNAGMRALEQETNCSITKRRRDFVRKPFSDHIWSESKYDNFDIPNIPKTDPDSPKRALSDRAMG